MATFTIKRGDTAPKLEISLSVAGSSPKEYWSTQESIESVHFIMKGTDNVIVGSTPTQKYTGIGTKNTNSSSKTVLIYEWGANDTKVAGVYNAEFELTLKDASNNITKRTFPSTDGDSLIINVIPDLNDEA